MRTFDLPSLELPNEKEVSSDGGWGALLEWTASLNGTIPSRALAGGVSATGEALYICRGLETGPPDDNGPPNDPLGEWTPGYATASSGFCQHEYFGQKNHTEFEVLALKMSR